MAGLGRDELVAVRGWWIGNEQHKLKGSGCKDYFRGFSLDLVLLLRLSATAARMRSFKAASSILSSSWMSIARLTLPSRLELKSLAGSFNEAPLANVIFTTLL